MNCTILVAKTKALISFASFAVTAKLICVFVFAYATNCFSHDAAHFIGSNAFYTEQKKKCHMFFSMNFSRLKSNVLVPGIHEVVSRFQVFLRCFIAFYHIN